MTPEECVHFLQTAIPVETVTLRENRELLTWDDLRQARARVGSGTLSAVRILIDGDMSLALDVLTELNREAVASIAAFLNSVAAPGLGTAWIRNAKTRSMIALGLQMWLRRICM